MLFSSNFNFLANIIVYLDFFVISAFKRINKHKKFSHKSFKNMVSSYSFYFYVYGIYKPDSKKVGTLYKLWIKKECNNYTSHKLIFYSQ